MKDFEFKKENYLEILRNQKLESKKVHRATTKGKFNEDVAQSPDTNYYKDISWLNKANPVASGAEKSFYKRDLELMEKRRFQKVI